jgi:enoyl-CoA hydratase
MSFVLRADSASLCTLTLNRPEALNALSPGLFRELRAHIEALASDESIDCILLRGAGRSFSAGNDLKALQAGDEAPYWGYQAETIDRLAALPQPVVAVAHGHCYTGALELALACDFIVCAASTKFADTHSKWAMVPSWGMGQRLPRRVGVARAKRMMFTGEVVDGVEAVRIGLATDCVPDEELDAFVAELASAIVANSRHSNINNKKFANTTEEFTLSAGLQKERSDHPGPGPDMHDRLSGNWGGGRSGSS